MGDGKPPLTAFDAGDPPTRECPCCDEDGPMLGRIGKTDTFACMNTDCPVSEFHEHGFPWRGLNADELREKRTQDE